VDSECAPGHIEALAYYLITVSECHFEKVFANSERPDKQLMQLQKTG
jgi:hypothetical protein